MNLTIFSRIGDLDHLDLTLEVHVYSEDRHGERYDVARGFEANWRPSHQFYQGDSTKEILENLLGLGLKTLKGSQPQQSEQTRDAYPMLL